MTMLNCLVASWIPKREVRRACFSNETAIRIARKPRAKRNERTVITSKIERSEGSLSLATKTTEEPVCADKEAG